MSEPSKESVEDKTEVKKPSEKKSHTQVDTKTAPKRYVGKVAVVTGSSDGLGYAIAYRLAQEGAHVVVSSRSKEKVDGAVDKIKAEGLLVSGLVADITKASDRKILIEHALKINNNKIDTLVNNVGHYPFGTLLEATSEQWDNLFNTNVKSSWELTKEIHAHIPKGGSIVWISSAAAYQPQAPNPLYGITKTLMNGLSQALSKELAPKGIRSNTVCPGLIIVPTIQSLLDQGAAPGVMEAVVATTTLKRIGVMDDVSGVVAFLGSDDAAYITGESITCAGGAYNRI